MVLSALSRKSVLLLATFCVATSAFAQLEINSWLDSPEAAFLTADEKQEWWTLKTVEDREAFKERYWARRDPTPNTPQNEFRDMVMQRVSVANQRFTLNAATPGAETWRGQVFMIFGAPARVGAQNNATLPQLNRPVVEGNEITEVWTYDHSRTPKILDALGRPSLEFTFVIEPVKQLDELENPGLFHQLRDVVARKTIMNKVVEVPAAPSAPAAATTARELTAPMSFALDHVEATTQLRTSVLWNGDSAATTFWLVTPNIAKADGRITLYGRVKDASGKSVATVVRDVEPASAFSLLQSGSVADATVALPPGEYDAAFILSNQNNTTLASGTSHVVVPEAQSQFAVSSLVLTDRVNAAAPGGDGIVLGRARVKPRADMTFTTAESMWYLFQVANPSDPSKVTVAVRLRHGAAPPTSPTVVPAALESIGSGRYMSGFEMPLSGVAPGEYTLYVSVHDPAGREDVVRRADFRVVAAPRLQ